MVYAFDRGHRHRVGGALSLAAEAARDRRASAGAPRVATGASGLRFIFRSPLLLPALTLDMFAVLFAGVTALLPAIAHDILHVGPFGYGMLRAAQSVGAVAMAVIGGRHAAVAAPGRVLLIVVALFGAATIGFGLSTSFPLSVVLLVRVRRARQHQRRDPADARADGRARRDPRPRRRGPLRVHRHVERARRGGVGRRRGLLGTVPAIVAGGAVAIIVVGVVALKWRELAAMPPLAELKPAARPS